MIVDKIFDWARQHPKRTAIIHNNVKHTYGEYAAYIDFAINFFESANLPPGKTAVVLISDLLLSWIVINALRFVGLNTVAVQSLDRARELKLKNITCVVVAESERTLASSSGGLSLLSFPESEMAALQGSNFSARADSGAKCGGHILYTSGTTGAYKKLLFEADSAERDSVSSIKAREWNQETIYHNIYFPLFTGVGFKWPMSVWIAGGCVVFNQKKNALLNIFDHDITVTIAVPTMLQELVNLVGDSRRKAGNFELLTGGGFVSLDLAEKIKHKITPNVTILFASTECSVVLSSKYDSIDDLYWFKPEGGRTVRIFADDGRECAANEEGDLGILLSDLDRTSYLDDAEATSKVFRKGYFFPGDLAVMNEDGRVRILGRTADVINIGGWKGPVAPLEQKIQHFLKARCVCLFSTLNGSGQDEVVVAVEADRSPTDAEAKAVRHFLRSFSNIRICVLSRFPRTATAMQKTNRRELRKIVFGSS